MRILLVTQGWPGPTDPDLGAFVALVAGELERLGHELHVVAIDHRGGSRAKYARMAADAARAARRVRPDVVYGHFLVPAGLVAAGAARLAGAPLVLTAHGQDVRNIGAIPGVRAATRLAVAGAARVVAVSGYLRDDLVRRLPALAGRVEVISSGVDLARFAPADQASARRELDLEGEGPLVLAVGTLTPRKNVERLAEAFARVGAGRLVLLGDGPLRARLERRPGVRVLGARPHAEVPRYLAAADVVANPSLVEPFGQAVLEAMACARPVVATRVGGPPEFVVPGAGVLVDPLDVEAIAEGLRAAASLGVPNATARAAAAEHDVARQARRIAGVLAAAVQGRRARGRGEATR